MFFLKKIFQKNLNIDEIEDLLFDNGVEPKFADLIISKIKENKSPVSYTHLTLPTTSFV